MMKRLEKKLEQEHFVPAALPKLSRQILEYARDHGRALRMQRARQCRRLLIQS